MDDAQLTDCLHPKRRELRDAISYDELEGLSSQNIDAIERAVDSEMLSAAIEARKAADVFWDVVEEERDLGSEPGKLATRVRVLKGTMQATWHRNTFTHVDHTTGEKQFFAKHIPRGRGKGRNKYRHSDSVFKHSPEWEQDIATLVEDRYAVQRERAAILSEIKRQIRKYKKAIEKLNQG